MAAHNRWKNSCPENAERTRELARIAHLRNKFGLTVAQFEAMKKAQNGLCKICGLEMTPPHVDHCHKSGIVRGLLCGRCNHGLGSFRDSPVNLIRASGYLLSFTPSDDFTGDAGC